MGVRRQEAVGDREVQRGVAENARRPQSSTPQISPASSASIWRAYRSPWTSVDSWRGAASGRSSSASSHGSALAIKPHWTSRSRLARVWATRLSRFHPSNQIARQTHSTRLFRGKAMQCGQEAAQPFGGRATLVIGQIGLIGGSAGDVVVAEEWPGEVAGWRAAPTGNRDGQGERRAEARQDAPFEIEQFNRDFTAGKAEDGVVVDAVDGVVPTDAEQIEVRRREFRELRLNQPAGRVQFDLRAAPARAATCNTPRRNKVAGVAE